MRKLNTILSVLLLVIFLLHGIMGSFMLLGIGSNAGKILACSSAKRPAERVADSLPCGTESRGISWRKNIRSWGT